jgi:hypothetical protein
MQPDSRQCAKCAAQKPLSEFSKAPGGKYGRKARCKACDAAYAAANKEKRRLPPGEAERRIQERRGATKQCSKCGEVKDRSLFSKAYEGKNGPVIRGDCKTCQSARTQKWHRDNRDRALINRRRWSLKKEYGISEGEYGSMLAAQSGVCAICGEDEPVAHGRTGTKFRLSVDHDHKTGKVRSLLCQRCNRAIGMLRDDVNVLRKALEYLLHHQDKPEE